MAHKKAAGSTRNGRKTAGKRRGFKKFGGQSVKAGNIILRQVGCKFHAGDGAGIGRDYTIYALKDGVVEFKKGYKNFINVA